jgi:hypothetical protein
MLSKSKFMRGLNCVKSLWLYVHKKNERYIDEATQSVFARGTDVGEIARQYFPGGKMVMLEDYPDYKSAYRTKQYIASGEEIIYEATFVYNNTLVAVDILIKRNGAWHLIEFKSTNSIKEAHIIDAAVQYHVIMGCGIPLEDVSVMHMNREYIRQGELDIKKLFCYESVLTEVVNLQENIAENITFFLQVEKQSHEPVVEMGKQCTTPYHCDFMRYCKKNPNLFSAIEKKELCNDPKIDLMEINIFLDEIAYPLYFFDFETIMPCIPMFDMSRPYQQIPFQYSLHYKQDKTEEIEHFEHLAQTDGDPRIGLIKQLIDNTKRAGSILVYNIGFERARLKEMQRDFPEYLEALENIILRLRDLMTIFRKPQYFTESMEGKYSIKNLLPDLCPELSYSNLEIKKGEDASGAFLSLYEEKEPKKINETRENLLNYCKMDTYAMVKILEVLEKKI